MMKNDNINVEIILSNRRTVSIEITSKLRVIVRAPFRMLDSDIQRFIKEKSPWLEKNMKRMQEKANLIKQQDENVEELTAAEINQLAEQAITVIPERVSHYAQIIGVKTGKITIRNQTSRWGSCSSKGNLNFNCLLMLMPHDVIDYVVVHELCHLKEMNHSAKFWIEVSKILPNYKVQKKWLKDNGNVIMRRMLLK